MVSDKRVFGGKTFTFSQMSKVKSVLLKTAKVFLAVGFITKIIRLKSGPDKGFFVLYARPRGKRRTRRKR